MARYQPRQRIKNFGDNLDQYIYRHYTGKDLPRDRYLLAGSVLKRAQGKIVWGAGFGDPTQKCGWPARIHAVRGRLTGDRLDRLGIAHPEVYGDAALCLPEVFPDRPPKRHRIGFVCHKSDTRVPEWALLIHPEREPFRDYLTKLLGCEIIVSTSLHGLVTADAFRIPSVWAYFDDLKLKSPQNEFFKYRDYYSATDTVRQPVPLELDAVLAEAQVMPLPDMNKLMQSRPF